MRINIRDFLLSLLCFFGSLPLVASDFNNTAGARSAALGNQATTLIDVFSVNNNQAGIGFIEEFSFGISANNKFIFKNINHFNAAAVFPTKTGVFGLNIDFYGWKLYNEKKIGIAFAKSFGEKFSFGLQFDYINLSIQDYGNKHLFTFEAGLQYFLHPKLLIGAHVFNPVRVKISNETNERLPTYMRFGLSYMPSKKVAVMAEVEKDLDFSPVFKLGIDYKVIDKLVLRGGINANPFLGTFGVGLNLKNLKIDLAAQVHPRLGVSPHFSLHYVIPGKK